MKARTLFFSLAAVAVLAVPILVIAQAAPGGGHGYGGHGSSGPGFGRMGGDDHGLGFFDRMLPRLAEELELTDEQLQRIEAIADDARPQIEAYVEQLKAGREAYRTANDDPTVFDEGAFRSHLDAQQEIQIELQVVVHKAKSQVFQVLTPEQREELESMRGEFGRKFKHRSGQRRGQ